MVYAMASYRNTQGRVRKPNYPYTPTTSTVVNHVTTYDYTLNRKSALDKKIANCDRNDCEIKPHAKCLVIKFSTVAYEYFRNILIDYYKSNKTVLDCVIDFHEKRVDTSKANTDDAISVLPSRLSNKKRQLYRINLFHTTCNV